MNRLVYFDLETSALRTRAWSLYDEHAIKYDEDWKLLCFAYKEPGGKVQFVRGKEKDIVKALHKVLDEHDIVVAHNAKKFDVRKANAKFFEYKLHPPRPFRVIDTLLESRKYFALTSHRLNDLARLLGLEGKAHHDGFETWEGCERGDEKAWAKMEKYNKQDVILLEQVYNRLHEWIAKPGIKINNRAKCEKCGGTNTQRRGERITQAGKFQVIFCKDCIRYFQGLKIIEKI